MSWPYPSNNKVLDGMEKRTKMNRRLFPGLLMTNEWRLYSQHDMGDIIYLPCPLLSSAVPAQDSDLEVLDEVEAFQGKIHNDYRPNPHKTSTCLIPVSNFWNRSHDPRSSDPLKSPASSPTSPDAGGSKVVVVASSIEPSTDLTNQLAETHFITFIPAKAHGISQSDQTNMWLYTARKSPGLPCPVPPPQHGLGHHPSPPSNVSNKCLVNSRQGPTSRTTADSQPCTFAKSLFRCLLVLGLLNSIQTQSRIKPAGHKSSFSGSVPGKSAVALNLADGISLRMSCFPFLQWIFV